MKCFFFIKGDMVIMDEIRECQCCEASYSFFFHITSLGKGVER